MRKLVAIICTIVFFLLILGAILFKIFYPASQDTDTPVPVSFPVVTQSVGATDQDPEQFVRSFYTWYLMNFSQDPLFPHPENRNEVLSPWLDSELLAGWDDIVSESEVNPVLLTADDPAPWGSAVSVEMVSQSIRTQELHATIGTGTLAHSYTVTVIKMSNGLWKIQSVASAL